MTNRTCRAALSALLLLTGAMPASAQSPKERMVEDFLCKDVMRDSGDNRDVAIAFLHGYLLGKSGGSKFSPADIRARTDAFVERCLDNPAERAVDAMLAIQK